VSTNGISLNGISLNGISLNGISLNGISLNGISLNGISLNGISLNGVSMNSTDIANFKVVLKYTVECAIPSGSSITMQDVDGSPYVLSGALGLAPEWAAGPIGVDGQEAVSACLLARANALGRTLSISMRGKWPGLATQHDESIDYPWQEGAF